VGDQPGPQCLGLGCEQRDRVAARDQLPPAVRIGPVIHVHADQSLVAQAPERERQARPFHHVVRTVQLERRQRVEQLVHVALIDDPVRLHADRRSRQVRPQARDVVRELQWRLQPPGRPRRRETIGVGRGQHLGEQRPELHRHPVLDHVLGPERERDAVALELGGVRARTAVPPLLDHAFVEERRPGRKVTRARGQGANDRRDPIPIAQRAPNVIRGGLRTQSQLERNRAPVGGRPGAKQFDNARPDRLDVTRAVRHNDARAVRHNDAWIHHAARRSGTASSSSGASTVYR
jgi:hypothetical protein